MSPPGSGLVTGKAVLERLDTCEKIASQQRAGVVEAKVAAQPRYPRQPCGCVAREQGRAGGAAGLKRAQRDQPSHHLRVQASLTREDLDRYYTDCVIGGPGAFMIPVNDWAQFPEAIRRKLVLELAGPDSPQRAAEEAAYPPVVLAQAKPKYDCLIGEKLWRDRSWLWDSR